MTLQREVSSVSELLDSAADPSAGDIVVTSSLRDVPSFRLSAGQALIGKAGVSLRFAHGQDGVALLSDNRVESLALQTDLERRAIFNHTGVKTLGRLELRQLSVKGLVQILARDAVSEGHVEAQDVDIEEADARNCEPRPKGYGVDVVQGAFTLWNCHEDSSVRITANLTGLRAGRPGAPVCGSGIFVSGGGDTGGKLIISRLETDAVYSSGGLAFGAPDRISGGVFVVSGAFVDSVCNRGPVTTYGPNDMVLDNWGSVDEWIADEKITSLGPSGIGFVNFGAINRLRVNAPIETFGQGARGFNVYAGKVDVAEFERVITHADGAVGVQISQPVGEIKVRRGIETFGGMGESLVKGVVKNLAAIPLSIKPGGAARKIEVAGGLIAHGKGVAPVEMHGEVECLLITGGRAAATEGFEAI
jgi:hypothetical protein